MVAAVIGGVKKTGTSFAQISRLRKSRAQAISALSISKGEALFRGQYEGYLKEPGVKAASQTETFMQVISHASTSRWKGTDVLLSAGKAMAESDVDIRITFRMPVALSDGMISRIVISLAKNAKHRDAYENIFLAAFRKDLSFFCSIEEVVAGWRFVKNVKDGWKNRKTPLLTYPRGSSGVLKINE